MVLGDVIEDCANRFFGVSTKKLAKALKNLKPYTLSLNEFIESYKIIQEKAKPKQIYDVFFEVTEWYLSGENRTKSYEHIRKLSRNAIQSEELSKDIKVCLALLD